METMHYPALLRLIADGVLFDQRPPERRGGPERTRGPVRRSAAHVLRLIAGAIEPGSSRSSGPSSPAAADPSGTRC